MADTKTTALTAATSWASGDLLYMVRDPAGTPVSRKITVDNILQNLVCAANTSLIKSTTGYSLTGSNASSMIDLAGTWNTSGNPVALKMAITNTASGATSKFLSCLAGASGTTEVFSVDKDGVLGLSPTFTINAGTQIGYFKSNGTTSWLMATNGGEVFGMGSGGTLGWSSGTSASQLSSCDLILLRDAANTLALRNAANAQAFNIYGTYTSGSVFERMFARYSVANTRFEIGTEHTGASARALALMIGSTAAITIATSGNATFSGSVTSSSTGAFSNLGRVIVSSPAAGVWTLQNNTQTDWDRLQFGGTTSSFPALKRSSTVLQSRLADDSDFAPLQGQIRTHANAVAETPTATHTITMYDASGTAYRVLCLV